ncbi:6762_t:CDS:2, partial [Scutellospora calospora]
VEEAIDYIGWMTKDGYSKSTNCLDNILELTTKECGGLGECKEDCLNFQLKNNIFNEFDMHKYSVHVITKVILSRIETEFSMQVILLSSHIFSILIPHVLTINRINLGHT